MQKRQRIVFVFICFFLCSACIFFLIKPSPNNWFTNTIFYLSSPVQKAFFRHAHTQLSPLDKAKQEIAQLTVENATLQRIAQDNKALRDQFQTTTPAPQTLIPVDIVSMPQFLPGISAPEFFILQTNGRAYSGMPVIYENMLLGKISDISQNFAKVQLVTSHNSSFTAKTTSTGAIGIVKGAGNGQIIFDNVVLSDTLTVGDIIITNGETSIHGQGLPPGLIVGKITSVEKNPSSLFQKASVQQLVDVTRLTMVFLLTQ